MSAAGGAPRVVALPDSVAAESFTYPQILPDGKTVLVTRAIPQGATRVVAVTLATGDTTTVVEDAATGRYVQTAAGDRLLYARPDGAVMAAPFDLRRRRVTGPAVPVASGAHGGLGPSKIAVALDGTFAFQSGTPRRRELVIREPDGALTVLKSGGAYRGPRFSPDGRQVAVAVQVGNDDARSDIWTYDLERGTFAPLTLDGASTFPEYSPDGRWISYASLVTPNDRDLLRVRVSGGTPETLLAAPGQQHEGVVTPDGATLVYREINARTTSDIWAVDLTRPADVRLRERRPLAVTPSDERGIALSPDGQWLAYQSTGFGRTEVYVRRLADSPERWPVSPGGGDEPRWDRSGRALYYRNGDTLFSVAVERAPVFRLGARRALFTGAFAHDTRAGYDVSADGRRFLLLRELEPDRPGEITVVLHALDGRPRTPRP